MLGLVAALHASVGVGVELLRPPPPGTLKVTIDTGADAAGDAIIISDEAGQGLATCTPDQAGICRVEVPRGTKVIVQAYPGQRSTFEGWTFERTWPWEDEPCPELGEDVRRCTVALDGRRYVTVKFGEQPEEVDVAMLDAPEAVPSDVAVPEPPRPEDPREEIDAETLDEVEVAVVPPLPPEFVPPPLPPPVPEQPKPPEEQLPPPPEMRMVEVPDENEVEDAPDDATHLSDKNRDVAEETRATETNLEKEQTGEAIASAPSDVDSEEIGGPEDNIRQLEDSEATTDERVEASDQSGEDEVAKGVIAGEEGEGGEDGEGEQAEPGMLSMRGIAGRGSIVDDPGGDGKKAGKRGKEGVKTQLDIDDYERIVGSDRAEKERELARRERSSKKGRYQKKLAAVKSALENFTPDIRPGNQTALKTRAHPFAVYVARMHRRIHELWGFGFLADLDKKRSDHPLNDFDLFVSVELAINPDGTVHKATIAKSSGKLEFDVAALDTVFSGAPYEQTPEKIRSVDHRVYLRWGFYRNWRQCGTFNVETYILTDIPGGAEPLADGMDTRDGDPKVAAQRGGAPVTPDPEEGSGAAGAHDHAGHAHATASNEAKYAANMWIAGFTSGSIERMMKVSAVPFYGGAEVAASTPKDLRGVYEALIVESGPMKSWELLSAADYARRGGGGSVSAPDGTMVAVVTAGETFAVVLVPTKSGEYRASAVVR